MKEERAERILSVLYISCAILSVTSLICLVTVWQYWALILDVCISIDCGCILYGVNTFSTFMGGDVKLCHFGIYGLIPAILIGLCLGGYHGYRSCINRSLDTPVRIYNDVSRYDQEWELIVDRGSWKTTSPLCIFTISYRIR